MKTNLLFCHSDQSNSLLLSMTSEQTNSLQFWNFLPSHQSSSSQYMNTSDSLFDFDQTIDNGTNLDNRGNDAYTSDNGIWTHVKTINYSARLIGI